MGEKAGKSLLILGLRTNHNKRLIASASRE